MFKLKNDIHMFILEYIVWSHAKYIASYLIIAFVRKHYVQRYLMYSYVS